MSTEFEFRKFFVSEHPRMGMTFDQFANQQSRNYVSPYVVEESDRHLLQRDVFSTLIEDRIIMFSHDFSQESCTILTSMMLFLEKQNPDERIKIYIDSPGGAVSHCLGVIDTMHVIKPLVDTYNIANAMSCGLVLACSATGTRYGLKHSRWLLHQVSGGAQGQLSDMKIQLALAESYENDIYQIISDATAKNGGTRKSIEQIRIDGNRDNFMKFDEAKAYGLVDEMIKYIH
jgi:ATP-dependent Clp protease protease subunit